jgi:hypothetical protein
MVQHNSFDLFTLDKEEWKQAIDVYPDLLEEDPCINYLERSANAWIEPKKDHYFTNEAILRQFERLFKLLKFKKQFQEENAEIEIMVDNATTHSAKVYDIQKFAKYGKKEFPYKKLEWFENETLQR